MIFNPFSANWCPFMKNWWWLCWKIFQFLLKMMKTLSWENAWWPFAVVSLSCFQPLFLLCIFLQKNDMISDRLDIGQIERNSGTDNFFWSDAVAIFLNVAFDILKIMLRIFPLDKKYIHSSILFFSSCSPLSVFSLPHSQTLEFSIIMTSLVISGKKLTIVPFQIKRFKY